MSAKKSSAQEGPSTVRARTIADLEEKLQKIKSEKTFSLKNKYIKKSLASKLNKKIKKKQRLVKKEKPVKNETTAANTKNNNEQSVNVAKPIFNNDGKLVFSKFDFANLGHKGDFFNCLSNEIGIALKTILKHLFFRKVKKV